MKVSRLTRTAGEYTCLEMNVQWIEQDKNRVFHVFFRQRRPYLTRMSKIVSVLLIVQVIALSVTAQTDTSGLAHVMTTNLSWVKQKVAKKIIGNRYMSTAPEARLLKTTDTIPGWEGNPVQLFEYSIPDKKDGRLTTKVYLLNADTERLARWVISACWLATGSCQLKYINAIINSINEQSNGQFPIRGIVYEDLDSDGIQETYPFFDGVSVECKGIAITTPARATPAELEKLLSMKWSDVEKIEKYGRIISTTRLDYKKLFPAADTTGLNWSTIVRTEYKKALQSDINWLIVAWAKDNPKLFH